MISSNWASIGHGDLILVPLIFSKDVPPNRGPNPPVQTISALTQKSNNLSPMVIRSGSSSSKNLNLTKLTNLHALKSQFSIDIR